VFAAALSLYHQGQLAEAAAFGADCLAVHPGDSVAPIYFNRCQG